jgi:hypothetical protein
MTDIQMLLIALAPVPTILAVVAGILINDCKVRRIEAQISAMKRPESSDWHSHIDERFDEMCDMVRDDLRGFGARMDARLKRLGER